jgi:hypothetical protein
VEEAELTLTRAETLGVRHFDKTDFRSIVPRFYDREPAGQRPAKLTEETDASLLNTSLVLLSGAIAGGSVMTTLVTARPVRSASIELLRMLAAAASAKTAGFGVRGFVPKWRTRHDSNV